MNTLIQGYDRFLCCRRPAGSKTGKMDVGTGIIREKIFENQWILYRSELVPEKGVWGAILFGGTQGQEREWGQRRGFVGGISGKIQDWEIQETRTGCQCGMRRETEKQSIKGEDASTRLQGSRDK